MPTSWLENNILTKITISAHVVTANVCKEEFVHYRKREKQNKTTKKHK